MPAIVIRNLAPDVTWEMLEGTFQQIGPVAHVNMAYASSGRSKGWGIVAFHKMEDAEDAVQRFGGVELGGKPMHVSLDTGRAVIATEPQSNSQCAVVHFMHRVGAEDAVEGFNGVELMGCQMIVRPARLKFAVVIRNLAPSVTWDLLEGTFQQIGPVVYASMLGGRTNWGIVAFHAIEDAEDAVQRFGGVELAGKPMHVSLDTGRARDSVVVVSNLHRNVTKNVVRGTFVQISEVHNVFLGARAKALWSHSSNKNSERGSKGDGQKGKCHSKGSKDDGRKRGQKKGGKGGKTNGKGPLISRDNQRDNRLENQELADLTFAIDASLADEMARTNRAEEAKATGRLDVANHMNSASCCVVCLDSEKEFAFAPCGHLCVCESCAISLLSNTNPTCPLCREHIEAKLKIFV